MGLKEADLPYYVKLQRNRRRFWRVFGVWILFCLVVGAAVYCLLPRLGPHNEPPLSGTAQFAVLALAVALAGYLRQIRSSALDLRDKIRGGEIWNYPPEQAQGREKMQALDDVADKLAFFGPFLIWLLVPTSGRMMIDLALRFLHLESSRFIFALDVDIALWFFFAFIGLAIAHYESRTYHDEIRAAVRATEDKLRPLDARGQSTSG